MLTAMDDTNTVEDGMPAGDGSASSGASIALMLERYGIDARARSALRALGRFQGIELASENWAEDLVDQLPATGAHLAHAQALSRFAHLFFQLPSRDFDEAWIDELSSGWVALLDAGCSPDLPILVARQFAAKCAQALARGRDIFSRLDAEIALAVGAASLTVCALLTQAGHERLRLAAPASKEPAAPRASGNVRGVLEAAMALDASGTTGLLIGQIEAGSTATQALEEEGWSHIYARSLSRLRQALRDRDVLCRIGRSRFAIVLPGLSSHAQVMLAAGKVARMFDSPLPAAGRECRLTVRIGACWAPDHAKDPIELLRRGNLALHEASRRGRTVAIFEQAVIDRFDHESRLEADFVRALDRGGLELHFQPQVDLKTGRRCGAEALLRWPGAQGGPAGPPLTLAVAERLGVGPQLTRWILHQACRTAAEFTQAGAETEISVNLTAGDIEDPELPLAVSNAMELWHVEPRLLRLELTESAMLANEAVSARVMASLRKLGVSTSLDDFGTGYSSVILLKKLPLNELKLDRSFVASAVQSRQDREIVRSLILLAHSLGLEVVAEGVEDAATMLLLRDFDCDRAQGFLISPPLPAPDYLAWAQAYDRGRPAGAAAPL